jgi:hypothetical protein
MRDLPGTHLLRRSVAHWACQVACWGGVLFSPGVGAESMDEHQLRAALVLRLAQYTQWPEPTDEFTICVAGLRRGETAVQALSGRAVGPTAVRVRTLESSRGSPGGDLNASRCQVLLLGQGDASVLRQWIKLSADAPVLVVGTSPEALRAGVCIALISEPQGLAFSVNHGELRRRGLSVAAPVLRLAREVR